MLDVPEGIRVSAVSSGLGALAGRPGLVSGASLIRDRAGRIGPADGGGSVLTELLGTRAELYDRLASYSDGRDACTLGAAVGCRGANDGYGPLSAP